MSDINFLASKKQEDDQGPKNQNDKEEKIVWSEPDDNRPIPKGTAFSMLPFFNKKKETRETKETKEPAVAPKPAADKNRIKESRQKILKLIKDHERVGLEKGSIKSSKGGYALGGKTSQSLLARLLEKFKRQPSHKEILVDYHRFFNQEKIKRSLPTVPVQAPINRAKEIKIKPVKQALDSRVIKENKLATPRPVKEFKESFLSKLFKLIKNKISGWGALKTRPVKINLTETVKEAKPKIVEAPRPKPVAEVKQEVKIKEKPPQETEPVQIDINSPKVIETNLIKGEIVTFFDWRKKSLTLMAAILVPVLLVSLIYLGLVYYQKLSQTQTQDLVITLDQLKEKIKQEESGLKEITDFRTRLSLVSKIFSKHIYWTNFFKFLEDNTIKDVYYADFSGDTSGIYPLSAIASRFSNISEQVDALRNNQKVTGIETTGGEYIPGDASNKAGVKFDFNLSILKDIFTE